MNYNFENRVAFVTGAGSGIGKSTARQFAQAGAAVVLTDINPAPIRHLTDEWKGMGYKALAIPCNVGKEEEAKAAMEKTVEMFGRLDFAFNDCAGNGYDPDDGTSYQKLSGTHAGPDNTIPQKRVGTPENITSCALYLCTDEASFMTGQTITIDGGFTVK